MTSDQFFAAMFTTLLGKTYAIYFSVVGIALMVDPPRFRRWYKDILNESRRVLFGGTISLLIGSLIIACHNHWIMDWPVIITLIGYWGVLSGAGCLISKDFIKWFKPMVDASDLVYRGSGLAWLALGLFLAYNTYFI